MGRIIAITNQKGGVGKTTTAINLSATLAEAGQRVLLVDFDPQGNASNGLGIARDEIDYTVYDALAESCTVQQAILKDVVERLDVLPADMNLAAAEVELIDVARKEFVLKELLMPVLASYDYMIIDCPPSLGTITINALVAADTVMIPIQCEYYALEGLNQVMNTIGLIQHNLNPNLRLDGVVFTMFDARLRLSQQVVDTVKENFAGAIYQTLIPRNVRLAEAPSHGLPITMYAPSSSGAARYRKLAQEVMSREDRVDG